MDNRTRALVGLLILGSLYLAWDNLTPDPAPVGQWIDATVSKPIAAVEKVEIKPAKLKVYAKPAKAKLKLPDAIQQDESLYVLSSSTVKPSLRPQTVTTVVNEATGESTTITRREAYPLLAFENTNRVSLNYGVNARLDRVGWITYEKTFAQVKGWHAGITATAVSDRSGLVGGTLRYEW
jgi:hypothetical protein